MTMGKMRVYVLARELNLRTDVVLGTAQQLGFDVKNTLSSLNAEQYAAIEKVLKNRPPDEPPSGVTSKLRPRGPRPNAASQRTTLPADDQED